MSRFTHTWRTDLRSTLGSGVAYYPFPGGRPHILHDNRVIWLSTFSPGFLICIDLRNGQVINAVSLGSWGSFGLYRDGDSILLPTAKGFVRQQGVSGSILFEECRQYWGDLDVVPPAAWSSTCRCVVYPTNESTVVIVPVDNPKLSEAVRLNSACHYVSALELQPKQVISVVLAGRKMSTYHEVDLSRRKRICTRILNGVMSGAIQRDDIEWFGLTSLGEIKKVSECRFRRMKRSGCEMGLLLIDYCATNELVLAAIVDSSRRGIASGARWGSIVARSSLSGNIVDEQSVDGIQSICISKTHDQNTLVVLTDRSLQAWDVTRKKLTLLSSFRSVMESEGTVSALDDQVLVMTREGVLSCFELQ